MIDTRSRYTLAYRAWTRLRTPAAACARFEARARRKTRALLVSEAAFAALVSFAALIIWSAQAQAFQLRGRVINLTTREPLVATPVSVVDPRHGMATEEKLQTDSQGGFAVASLSDEVSVYLVQVNYAGVVYTEMVRPAEGTVETEVRVYDTTTSWDSVQVSIPHLMARRTDDTLSVDRIFSVINKTNPPRTILGEGAGFRLFIPEEKLGIPTVFATSLGVPIAVEPRATETPGVFTVDFPFKPGETRVGASFDVAYTGERYEYREPLQYPVGEVVVMTEDPSMEVTSSAQTLGEATEARGFKAYRLAALPKSATLAIAFRGGEAQVRAAREPDTGHEVVLLQEPWQNASVIMITGFALLLVLVMAFAAKSPSVEADETALLTSRKNSLLNRIARLDDLFEMGAVTGELHKSKRRELVDALSSVMYRLERAAPRKSRTARQAKKDDA
jgi:hypothetical protein